MAHACSAPRPSPAHHLCVRILLAYLLAARWLVPSCSAASFFRFPWPAERHDYRDALAKSILFFEGQRSGKLPPGGNGVAWKAEGRREQDEDDEDAAETSHGRPMDHLLARLLDSGHWNVAAHCHWPLAPVSALPPRLAQVATRALLLKARGTVFRRIFIVVSFFGFRTAITFLPPWTRAPRAL